MYSVPAAAQDWEIEPYIEVIATYTDNLYLLQKGFEISDYVGQVNPGINIVRNDGRFTTDTSYRMQNLFFADDSDLDTIFHQLNSSSTLELAAETFFIDVDAAIEQSILDPTRPISTSNVITTSNYGDVIYADINPYLVQRLGNSSAYARVDYTWGIGRYEDFGLQTFSRVDDFDQESWRAYLGTAQQETGFDWALTYDRQFVNYETISDYKFERAGAMTAIPLMRNIRLLLLGGFESDVFVGRDIGGLDSDYWEVGFSVNSGERNNFEVRVGERFFGRSYFGNFEYEGNNISATISYTENPTTSALSGPGSFDADFSVSDLDPIFDEDLAGDELIIVPIRAEAYISKMLSARIEVSGARSLLFLAYADEDREFIDLVDGLAGQEDGQDSLTLGYRYELGSRTELEFSVATGRYDYPFTDVHSDVVQIVLGVSRRLGSQTDLRASIRRSEQEIDNVSGFGDYVENAIEVGLVRRF
ncbi:MAG TPA: TIGR03016 family PEP-CTERM system-associated outer membrane protein [Woeseiaceae bacterium]|nr:TIGR03016 family PEP-CTERM system-associated outer membrane protein [Woeseiaceae bacterium]